MGRAGTRHASPGGAITDYEPLSVSISDEGSCIRIAAYGELDAGTAEPLREALARAIEPGSLLELDLSGLTFMDSTGLQLLVRARNAAEADGYQFVVVAPSRPVKRVLDLVGMTDVLEIAPEPSA